MKTDVYLHCARRAHEKAQIAAMGVVSRSSRFAFRCARWGKTSVNPRCQYSLQRIAYGNWSASVVGVASLSVLGGKNVGAESVRGAVGVRCPDLRGKMRPLLGGISSTV